MTHPITFCLQILRISIEDVDILGVDVDVLEQVLPHERVVGLVVVAWQADILVHAAVAQIRIIDSQTTVTIEENQTTHLKVTTFLNESSPAS